MALAAKLLSLLIIFKLSLRMVKSAAESGETATFLIKAWLTKFSREVHPEAASAVKAVPSSSLNTSNTMREVSCGKNRTWNAVLSLAV